MILNKLNYWFEKVFEETKIITNEPFINVTRSYSEVEKFLDNIPNINSGGCGISALVLYDAAKAEGKNPEIFYCWRWKDVPSIINNQNYILGKAKTADSANRIIVGWEVNGKMKYFHSEGEIDPDDEGYVIKLNNITRTHLVDSIKYGGWNDMFERERWLPEIERYIGYKLL